MSSDSGESHSSAHQDHGDEIDTEVGAKQGPTERAEVDEASATSGLVTAEADEDEVESIGSGPNGLTFARTRRSFPTHEDEETASELSIRPKIERPGSPESTSTPDDTPSIQGSGLSSPGSSVPVSHSSLRPHRPASLQPFERRFSARLSPSPLASPRGASPAFLSAHSRQSSVSSNLLFRQLSDGDGADTPQAPWDVVRWTKLKKITGQVFSEVGKRNFGRPTCLNVTVSLVIGTSKGFILVFDYQQVLKSIIGPGTKAVECGAITALAISADHSTVAGGHATGHIFTWELAKPAKPFLHIPPLERATLDDRKSDGHVSGVGILHLGFLGTRHTALASADDGGMAFSHLATRGLGAIARSVKITRILGRYPPSAKSLEKPRKPSSVLAFSPLPLGNVEQPTDDMGLTALLTPYLLVIVSTTPVAQTQHKAPRPKEVAPHSALSGCLAWFPAVKLKNPSNDSSKAVSKTKLVYCWSNVLTILDVDSIVAPPTEKEKPTELRFRPRSRWKAEEAVVAVQWLSRSVLGVLTISQRLVILEDNTLRMTDSFDLLQKHIYHSDLFSRQLRPVIEQLDEQDVSMHGVVADAFYMSFRAYKGRLFLLGFNDVSIGTLSNWADRLMALMEDGDFIAAIGLATSYYVGDADKLTVGLPEDDKARHTLVQEKLLEMITASLKYTFSRDERNNDEGRDQQLKELAEVVFTGLFSMKEFGFLFEDVYDAFEEASAEKAFFETLEPYILDDEITAVPPNVLKDLITFYASANRASRLEEMICRLSTDTMDINQVTTLCQQYVLYDALIYVWTRAIGDYITPLTNILELIKLVDFDVDETENIYLTSAKKIFPYLAYTFTGRIYPGGAPMDDEQAHSAKKDMYRFVFSGKSLQWPPGSGEIILTRTDAGPEPPFPYLQLILEFDASSFMSMLNEAFEDSFLNGEQETTNGTQVNGIQQGSTLTPTRQYIINILFGVMTTENFDLEDILYFYMFVARNLPKYPQHIMLRGTLSHQVLVGLCHCPTEIMKEDCQLSVEYLLSMYHPPDPQSLIPLFEKAGFHRVLKSVYRGEKQYAKLLETYLDDSEDEEAVFGCISDVLRPSKGLIKKQVSDVKRVIVNRATELVAIDASQTAITLKQYAPDLLEPVLEAIEDDSDAQYRYLAALIEPEQSHAQAGDLASINEDLPSGFIETYVQLMCTYNSSHVADFVTMLKSSNLRLDPILPALEQSGVIDAAVILMARDGLVKDAMDRLVGHLGTLETALTGLITAAAQSPDVANTEEAVHDLLEDIQKYIKVGIWLCQGQTRSKKRTPESVDDRRKSAYGEIREGDLALDELLWLDLVDTSVRLIRDVSDAVANLDAAVTASNLDQSDIIDSARIVSTLRSSIQQTFSALLASTTIPPATQATSNTTSKSVTSRPPLRHTQSQVQSNPSFLRILRCFLTRATHTYSPSLGHLRSVLAEVFAAYTFEETILSLANRFLDKESFEHVHEITELRKRGWRPRGQTCEGCKKRAWGPGAGAANGLWEAWEKREAERSRKRIEDANGVEDESGGKGKGKRPSEAEIDVDAEEQSSDTAGALVLFACRHLWHKKCVEKASVSEGSGAAEGTKTQQGRLKCPLCG
ncbi:Vacuolar protein sorting-associated protein 8 [Neocucurbitaria cava]|uniref:Vacuolar protein sorting-associated protein 8 n=1 Tax=Neocucurbitaria cava TaxID=798079 RepID=A0A9W9CND4_9PLEO|nr:Vacuolar protein sorting-associated protein 8 [Neocucurbitaria cava]